MARIFGEGSGKGVDAQPHHLEINDAGAVRLPDGIEASSCELSRDGQDLVLTTPDGQVFVVENYFALPDAPVIISDSGALLSPALVLSFIKPAAGDVQVAATEHANDASPVGEVTEVSGEATVTHADGTKEKIASGTQIFEGDIVETDAKGAVNIKFADDSTFAVSENARLAVDDFSFNPADQSGTTGLSILRGVFMFTSGLIGRENPDAVTLETPVGSIGIRGTIIGGNIHEGGQTTISVIEGAIVVRNDTGEQILSQQFETVTLTAFSQPITNVGTMDAHQMTQTYGSVRPVSPTLFTSIDDTARDHAPAQQQQTQPEQQQTQPETGPQSNDDSQNNAPEAPVQPPVLTDTPVFQTLTTGSNIGNSLGAQPPAAPQIVLNDNPAPVTGTGPQTSAPPLTTIPPVQDVGDRRPPSGVTIVSGGTYAENNAIGAEVARVSLSDSSMKFPVRYELVNNTGPFTIDAEGRIFATARGDYEADAHDYNFIVRATRPDTGQSSETPLTLSMTNIDEAPVFGNPGASVAEAGFVILSAATIGATDPEGQTGTLTYTVVAQNKGVIEVDTGSGFAPSNTFTQAQLDSGKVKFLHLGDEPGSGPANFTLHATDSTGHTSVDKTVNVTVSGTNDAPIQQVSAGGTVLENSTTAVTGALLNHTDTDNSPDQITYTVVSSSHGMLQKLVGSTWTDLNANDQFTQADINSGKLQFVQNHDEDATAGVTYRVSDGTVTSGNKDLTFVITNVNDDPMLDHKTVPTVAENGTLGLTTAMMAYTDNDPSQSASDLLYTVTAMDHGKIQKHDGAWSDLTIGQTFTQQDIDDGLIQFVQDGSEDNEASFSYTLSDGVMAMPISDSFTMNVTPVNDAASAPTIASSASLAERAGTGSPAVVISNIVISDGESPANNPDYQFSIKSWTGTAWAEDSRFEVVNNAGLWQLRVKQDQGFDHETGDTIQLQVSLTDGANTTVTSGTLTLNITDVNEASTSFELNHNLDYSGATGVDALVQGKVDGAVIGVLRAQDIDTLPQNHPGAADYKILSIAATSGTLGGLSANDFEIVDRVRDGKMEQILRLRDGVSHSFGTNDTFTLTVQLDADQDGTFDGASDLQQDYTIKGRNDTMVLEMVDGTNGFHITNNARVGTGPGAYFGNSIAVGDYNHDGTPDLVIGAPRAVAGNTVTSGGFYGIAGTSGLITDAADGNVNLQTVIDGGSSAGFFSENGIANAFYSAQVAIIQNFSGGKSGLVTVDPGNGVVQVFYNGGTTGVTTINNIAHAGSNTFGKLMLGSVGDINGDGFGDLLIGSPTDPTFGSFSGTVNLYLGNSSQASTLDYQNAAQYAAQLHGTTAGETFGGQIAGLGDFDGDGRTDFAISSSSYDTGGSTETGQGRVTVYFGSNNVSSFETNKFVIDNLATADQKHLGSQLAAAGDFNGDGRNDLLIRADNGVTLVYGEATGQRGTHADLSQLNSGAFHGATFIDSTMSASDRIGGIAGGIDFNADGFDDVVIDYAKGLGGGMFEHTLFVVYGNGNNTATYDLAALRNDEAGAFKIRLLEPTATDALTLTAAGDYNGDGYDDLLVGNPADSNNHDGVQDGSVTMVYGSNYDGRATEISSFGSADPGHKTFVGTQTSNTLDTAGEGGVSFRAGAGDDTFILRGDGSGVPAGLRNFEGGAGKDTLRLFFSDGETGGNTDIIDLQGAGKKMSGVEIIEFDSGSKMDTLILDIKDVLTLASANDDHKLRITAGGAGDDLNGLQIFSGGTQASNLASLSDNTLRFTHGTDVTEGSVTYSVYTHNVTGAQLLVDQRLAGAETLAV